MKFGFDKKTGTFGPMKDENIYFSQSQGGGLIIDDKKHHCRYIIERNGDITVLFGNVKRTNELFNMYNSREIKMIEDRIVRLFGRNHPYFNLRSSEKSGSTYHVKRLNEF